MLFGNIPRVYQETKRMRQIAVVFARHGFYDVVSRARVPWGSISLAWPKNKHFSPASTLDLSPAQRLRMAFEELGPTFIKLGQMLSLEPDIIPAGFAQEFEKLQDKIQPFPFEEIREIIESELTDKIENLFRYIDPTPIAAASIAQVHFGELLSGEQVAIKVRRPQIEKSIHEDIWLLKKIAKILETKLSHMDLLNPVAIVNEFEHFITREIDFTNEAASTERFGRLFQDDSTVSIPKIYWKLTKPRVLVMEHLDGIALGNAERIKAAGLDPDEVARKGLQAFAKQILMHGFFHADPHPGNALVMPNGGIGLIDFGIIGFIDQELMRHLANIFLGYADHDYDRVIRVLFDMQLVSDSTNLKEFKYDLMAVSEPFYGRSLQHIQIKDIFERIVALAVKYRIRLHRELILLFKTLIAMEGVGRRLSSSANILAAMKPFAIRLLEQRYDPKKVIKQVRQDLSDYTDMVREYPDLFHKLLNNLVRGNQRVVIEHKIDRLEEIEKKYILSSNRITLGVVTGTSVLAGAWMLGSGYQYLPLSMALPFIGVTQVHLTTILGLISYTIATILGLWLIFSMFFHWD